MFSVDKALRKCDGYGMEVSEKLPPDVASRRDAQVRYCGSKGCLWCFCLNVLAGGFTPKALGKFKGDDRDSILAHADELMQQRLDHAVARRQARERRARIARKPEEQSQGELV